MASGSYIDETERSRSGDIFFDTKPNIFYCCTISDFIDVLFLTKTSSSGFNFNNGINVLKIWINISLQSEKSTSLSGGQILCWSWEFCLDSQCLKY